MNVYRMPAAMPPTTSTTPVVKVQRPVHAGDFVRVRLRPERRTALAFAGLDCRLGIVTMCSDDVFGVTFRDGRIVLAFGDELERL